MKLKKIPLSGAILLTTLLLLLLGLFFPKLLPAFLKPFFENFRPQQNWKLTVYYTPVEIYHSGEKEDITGCLISNCVNGTDYLGAFPQDFISILKIEGVGKISHGQFAGKYLHYSAERGFWIDTAARDYNGKPLVPFQTAAADGNIPFGTQFKIKNCGIHDTSKKPLDKDVCDKLKAVSWKVEDRFSKLNIGYHFDLYVGEENAPNFTVNNPFYFSVINAHISF